MVDRMIDNIDELKRFKKRLEMLNKDIRYYVNLVMKMEDSMREYERLIYELEGEIQEDAINGDQYWEKPDIRVNYHESSR